jgi:hypothetical protein
MLLIDMFWDMFGDMLPQAIMEPLELEAPAPCVFAGGGVCVWVKAGSAAAPVRKAAVAARDRKAFMGNVLVRKRGQATARGSLCLPL